MQNFALLYFLLGALSLSSAPIVWAQQTTAQCTTYPNGICSSYINYTVYLPANTTFGLIEQKIAGTLAGLSERLSEINYACVEAYYQYACPLYFPKCTANNATDATQFIPEPTCTSACQKVIQECSIVLTTNGQSSLIPKCDTPSPVSQLVPQPDGSCNAVDPKDPVKAAQGLNLSAVPVDHVLEECTPPFVKDPLAKAGTNDTIDSTHCRFGCCIPCPSQNYFYKTNWSQRGFLATDVLRITSAILSFFILLSYLFLPDKRRHPHVIVLNISICIVLFSIPSFFSIPNPLRLQCSADGILPSTMDNNAICAVQSSILIFATFGSTMWCVVMIVNLHLHTVWNSSFLTDKYFYLNIICWGVPCAVLGTTLGMHAIKFEFANLCLVQVEYVFDIFFYPLAALVIPSFIAHCATFLYIGKITFQSGVESDMSQSLSSSHGGGTAAYQQHAVRIHRRHHVMEAVRIQWRALLMTAAMTVSVVFYWLFYLIQIRKMTILKDDRNAILPWLTCMMTYGNTQDDCTSKLSDYMPPFGLMVFAESLVSLMGVSLFLNFFKWDLLREWNDFFYNIRFSLRRRRDPEKNGDQFIAL
ncbi:hypothetical protein BX666DRAFT_2027312 [Dichotomocladium elegans]|nr:hypothetical protein BX666DRAFT_2027312 [Dichotomocladium elegans]